MAIPTPINEGFVAAVRKANEALGKQLHFAIALIPGGGDKWMIKLVELRWLSHPTSIIYEVAQVQGVASDQRLLEIMRLAEQHRRQSKDIVCCELSIGSRWTCLDPCQLNTIVDASGQTVSVSFR